MSISGKENSIRCKGGIHREMLTTERESVQLEVNMECLARGVLEGCVEAEGYFIPQYLVDASFKPTAILRSLLLHEDAIPFQWSIRLGQ